MGPANEYGPTFPSLCASLFPRVDGIAVALVRCSTPYQRNAIHLNGLQVGTTPSRQFAAVPAILDITVSPPSDCLMSCSRCHGSYHPWVTLFCPLTALRLQGSHIASRFRVLDMADGVCWCTAEPLTEEQLREKEELTAEGFELWSGRDFRQSVSAL